MKLRYLSLALGLSGLLVACDQPPSKTQTTKTATTVAAVADSSPVLATVNGEPITEAVIKLYQDQMQARAPGNPAAMSRESILNEVINLELARQSGEKEGVGKDTKVQLQVEQQTRAVLASAAIQQYMSTHPISDEDLKKIYAEQVPKGNEYKARHILLKDEETAKKLIAELDKGADFSELAKKHSTGPSGKTGGELGWFSPKQMVAQFSEATAKLEKGTYTKEPVKTQFGWHIIMLDDLRTAAPPSFEQVKPQLEAFVQKQRVQEYITRLRESAKIVMTEPPAAAAPQPKAAEQAASTEPAAT
ncbi:MAG TPA: peptidylprolyl isomerase, partial [Gammaproteobacteria bacterium]|nr:peptidylprolyl isomerase [Gammaproteobacteria bacterium]